VSGVQLGGRESELTIPECSLAIMTDPTMVTNPHGRHCKHHPCLLSSRNCCLESHLRTRPENTFLFYLNGCATLIKGLLFVLTSPNCRIYIHRTHERRPRGDG
jgi:hypothetical protein